MTNRRESGLGKICHPLEKSYGLWWQLASKKGRHPVPCHSPESVFHKNVHVKCNGCIAVSVDNSVRGNTLFRSKFGPSNVEYIILLTMNRIIQL